MSIVQSLKYEIEGMYICKSTRAQPRLPSARMTLPMTQGIN